MAYGTNCIISIISLIIAIIAAVVIVSSYEFPDLKTENDCMSITSGITPKVGDSCKVWDDNTKKCLKGSIVKKSVNGIDQLFCEKKPITLGIVFLAIAGLSFIAAIVFGYLYYKNKSA
jgi:hypothetical protein